MFVFLKPFTDVLQEGFDFFFLRLNQAFAFELADIEPQEIESFFYMRDVGFLLTQFSSSFFKPFLKSGNYCLNVLS